MSNFKDYNIFTYREILSGVAYCEHPETKLIELSVAEAREQELLADLKLLHKHLGTDVPISSLKADAIEEMLREVPVELGKVYVQNIKAYIELIREDEDE